MIASNAVIRACSGWIIGPAAGRQTSPSDTDEADRAVANARTSLRTVRIAIEQYRNDRHVGLRRLAGQLLMIGFSAALATLLLLATVIAASAPRSALVGAAAVYVVGAGVGLFSRLYTGSAAVTAIEDYGLTNARVLITPVVSGIAAVIGVLLTGYVTVSFNPMSYHVAAMTPNSTPTSTAVSPAATTGRAGSAGTAAATSTSSSQGGSLALRPLSEMYDLSLYPFDLVIAAIFGFAPKLVLDNLQQQADKYKSELQSSQPSDGGAKTPAKP